MTFYEGPKTAKIALVGEAPGEQEVRSGRPFVGPAGILLNDCLLAAGIPRSSCYIDNVFQFRPKGNNLTPFLDISKKHAKETQAYHDAREALLTRLRETDANLVVALGNVPLYTLLGLRQITSRRGSIYWSDALGKKVLACIHPSAALREYKLRRVIVSDLVRARAEAERPELVRTERRFILEPTLETALAFLRECESLPAVGYDIETRGKELSHIAFAKNPHDVICIPFVDGPRDYWTPDQEASILRAIAHLLEARGVRKIAQNISFDATFLYAAYGIITEPFEDTMIAAGVLLPEYPKGLDFLTSIYCNGEPYYKDDGKEWFKNPFGDELTFRRYNAMDAAVLMEIWPEQKKELQQQKNWASYERQRDLVPALTFASARGLRLDHEGLRKRRAACEKRITELRAEFDRYTGGTVNPASSAQVQQYFYIQKGLRPHTRKGRITADEKALLQMASKGVREAELLLALRHEQKLLGTYYKARLDPDGRLRCSYNPVGTKSGRISSSKTLRGTGMNLQNQPPDMASLFLADPGYILVNQDLGQAENRVVAYVSGESKMMQAFDLGIDIHKQTAALMYSVPVDSVTDEQRQMGKRANHGLNYGQSAQGFALIHQMPLAQARYIHERYHLIYPGVTEWHYRIQDTLAKERRTLHNCFGEARAFLDRWGHSLFKEAYSYIPQSTVARLMNTYGWHYLYERQDLFPECIYLNTIHDSLVYEIPLSVGFPRIVEILRLLKRSLERSLHWGPREFRIPVDTSLGFSLDKPRMLEWKAKHFDETPMDALAGELESYVARETHDEGLA